MSAFLPHQMQPSQRHLLLSETAEARKRITPCSSQPKLDRNVGIRLRASCTGGCVDSAAGVDAKCINGIAGEKAWLTVARAGYTKQTVQGSMLLRRPLVCDQSWKVLNACHVLL